MGQTNGNLRAVWLRLCGCIPMDANSSLGCHDCRQVMTKQPAQQLSDQRVRRRWNRSKRPQLPQQTPAAAQVAAQECSLSARRAKVQRLKSQLAASS